MSTARHASSNISLIVLVAAVVGLGTAVAVLLVSGVLGGTGPENIPTALPAASGTIAAVIAAGDVATCSSTDDDATAALVDSMDGTVLLLGDAAYPAGRADDFEECYAPTWGRHLERTRAVPGNHDYDTPAARPFFRYFDEAAGPAGRGYYSFDLGTWHVIALNSECEHVDGGCDEDSEQVEWLREDLAATDASCVLAFWHEARFSSGEHGDTKSVGVLWEVLAEAHADLVLAAHDHDYERFEPLDANGDPDPDGMPSFVVGSGGAPLREIETARPGSFVRDDEHHGVLRLELTDGGYSWAFVDTGPRTLDEGVGRCRA